MRTNGQKDALAPRHFSCHQRELPRAFWFLSQRGGTETVNRSHAIRLMCQRCRAPVQSSPSDRCCQYIDDLSGSLLQPSAACSWWTARTITCQPSLLLSLPSCLTASASTPPSLSQYLSNTACRNRRHGRWWNGKHLSRSICHSIHVDRQARRPTGNEEWERLSAKRKELSKKIQKIRSKEKENDKVSML